MNDRTFDLKSFLLAFAVSCGYGGLGFAALHLEWADYGLVIFFLLPFLMGASIGWLKSPTAATVGGTAGIFLFYSVLFITKNEGLVCLLMATPTVFVMAFCGAVLSHFLRLRYKKASQQNLSVGLLPVVGFLLIPVENAIHKGDKEVISVSNVIELPYSALQVYDAIKHVDTLDAPKPWLMKLDLPVPMKCVLQKEEVGALRTCYFEGGTITERVTAIEPGKTLRMDVIDYQLTGRKWLGFEQANYSFEALPNGGCRMTRETTYTSELKPRFYWAPLEQMGIEQEHGYVFDNLRQDLERLHGAQ